MHYILGIIFELDVRLRKSIRFLIELIIVTCICLSLFLEFDEFQKIPGYIHFVNLTAFSVVYYLTGMSNDRLRYSSLKSFQPIIYFSLIISSVILLEGFIYFSELSLFNAFLFFILFANGLLGFRLLARQLIRNMRTNNQQNVLVFGTSDAAIDLVNAMSFGRKYNVKGFISDGQNKLNKIAGLPVLPLQYCKAFSKNNDCELVVLVSPVTGDFQDTYILSKLENLGFSYCYAPTIDKAFDYEVKLKAIDIEVVLGRKTSTNLDEDLKKNLFDKSILVTGAAGSIGSELCRQLLRYDIGSLIALDSNEFALYNLEQELLSLSEKTGNASNVKFVLGSVTDRHFLKQLFENNTIDFVYHAAAYKHVPIVEDNIPVAIQNNVFGTKNVAEFAKIYNVERFVFISTDKAVRPTNVMGATKRVAELIIQNLSTKKSKTTFSIVRFGNVLGSSGSVIPKFKSQITKGGPVTVTHPEITRYFMSIPEASHLVMQAGNLSSSGDVFLLDMGSPVKIVDLAKSMIRQHGLKPIFASTLSDREMYHNEMLIQFTGLRPGEKLYEELLVNTDKIQTVYPKIFKSTEPMISDSSIKVALQEFDEFIAENNDEKLIKVLKNLPIEFVHNKHLQNNEETSVSQNTFLENVQEHLTIDATAAEKKVSKHRLNFIELVGSSKVVSFIMHRYFLLVRGMTLGVRIIVQNEKNELLLVKHTYLPNWHLPGGGVEKGENILDAARRELFEETGLNSNHSMSVCNVHHNILVSKKDYVVVLRTKCDINHTFTPSIEISDARFFPMDSLPDNVDQTTLQFLSNC